MSKTKTALARTPLLEWIAGGVGLILLLFLLGAIGYDGLTGASAEPPAIEIDTGQSQRAGTGFVVPFEAVNLGGGTAAALEVEGQLLAGSTVIETSSATIDYVPGHGKAEGGLFFRHDPAGLKLVARPLGFQKP